MKYTMSRDEKVVFCQKLIDATEGKFFNVVFRKKDGTVRNMNCRIKVGKFVKGVGLSYDPKKLGNQIVWESVPGREGKELYRQIRLESIERLKINGSTYDFDDNILGDLKASIAAKKKEKND